MKTQVPLRDQAVGKGANLISVLELYAVFTALWALDNKLPGDSTTPYIDKDAAAQVLTKGGSNRSVVNHLVGAFWFLAARNSGDIWPERVSSTSSPANVPNMDGLPQAGISVYRPSPSSQDLGGFPFSASEISARRGDARESKPLHPPLSLQTMGRLVRRASDSAWRAIRRDAPARQKITYDLLARGYLDKFLSRLSRP